MNIKIFVHLQTSLLHCLKSATKTIGEGVPIKTIMIHLQPFKILFLRIFLDGSSKGLRYQQNIKDHKSYLEKLEQLEYQDWQNKSGKKIEICNTKCEIPNCCLPLHSMAMPLPEEISLYWGPHSYVSASVVH